MRKLQSKQGDLTLVHCSTLFCFGFFLSPSIFAPT
jgi:hypothetical protein